MNEDLFQTLPGRVIAHRGASADRPENTAAAFEEALAQGCDAVELDVQLSRDGVPVVYHDRSLEKLGRAGRIAERSWEELRGLDAGAWFGESWRGEPLLRLEDALGRFAGRVPLLVEVKVREEGERLLELARRVARLVAAAQRADEHRILSFDSGALAAGAAAAPGLRRVLNLRGPSPAPGGLPEDLDAYAALSIDRRRLSADFVAAAHAAGLPVMVFTCNEEGPLRAALAAGADALMSDRPAWLRARLAASGAEDA